MDFIKKAVVCISPQFNDLRYTKEVNGNIVYNGPDAFICKQAREANYKIVGKFFDVYDFECLFDAALDNAMMSATESVYHDMAQFWLSDDANHFEAIFTFVGIKDFSRYKPPYIVYHPQPSCEYGKWPWERYALFADNPEDNKIIFNALTGKLNEGIITEFVFGSAE